MAQTENTLQISHINIRISISILVFKLFVVEIFSLAVVIAFYTLLFTAQNTSMIFVTIGSLSIPLLIILAILKFALTLFIIIQWINEYYEITTTAIFHRRGVIFRNEEKYLLTHIQMIVVHQTLIGRMFNF
ncbi:MAG TPA: PH domain-containing protein, partial [Patescibacteria group bacterium]|nr:PH domain-containing protein [Patescibacteria group bacterium]